MSADRDPRINPMPGDSLTCGDFTVTIIGRIRGLLSMDYGTPQTGRTQRYQAWLVGEWREACKQESAVVRKGGAT